MSLTNKLKNAGYWQTLQTLITIISQFAYLGVMARLLSKADYGLMAIAGGFIGIGTIFSEGGMSAALIQRKNITQKHMNAALQGGILFGLLFFFLLFFLAKYIAVFFHQPELTLLTKVIGVNIILNSVSGISMGLLEKYFRFNKTAIVTMASSIIGYVVGIVLAFHNYGVWSLVFATLTTSILNTIGFFYYAPVRFSLNVNIKEWKELFSFGSGILLLKTANFFSDRGINLILGKVITSDLLGVFERTSKIKLLPSSYIGKILDTIMFPAMSEIQDEHERLFRIYQQSLGMVNSLLMPISVFLICFSKEIVLILLGNGWEEAVLPLQIMFVVLPFSSSGRMADMVIRAKGLIYKNVVRKYIYVTVLISTTALGAYFYGVTGAAIGVTFSFLFNYVIMLFLVKRIFKKPITEIFLKPVVEGSKLTGFVLLIIFVLNTLLNNWEQTTILNFLIISCIIAGIILIIVWKKPSLLGHYLYLTISQLFFNKKK